MFNYLYNGTIFQTYNRGTNTFVKVQMSSIYYPRISSSGPDVGVQIRGKEILEWAG